MIPPTVRRNLPHCNWSNTLRDYFDLQLRFAAAMAHAAGLPLDDAVLRYTNLHRRLGLGHVRDRRAHPQWHELARRLAAAGNHEQRLACTMTAYAGAGAEPPPPGQTRFGAFACNAPDANGVVRIHFSPHDDDGISPLHPDKVLRRRGELRALIQHVVARHTGARVIRGTSWLYHLPAYRRLFPPAYAASATLDGPSLRYEGTANWGQFLTHRGTVKPGPRAHMLANLPNLDPARPWLVFPLPALTPEASVAIFVEHYAYSSQDTLRW